MNDTRCPREDEILDALGRGFVGPELDAHAAECAACGELRLVAGALLDDRGQAVADAPVPSAGTMLWRMQMRRRRDVQASARRWLLVGQAMTLAVAGALIVALFGAEIATTVRGLAAALPVRAPLLLALAASLLLAAPIAGWVAVRGK